MTGNQSITTTQRYIDINDDMLRNVVELLLKKGANIKSKNDKRERPFTYADKKDKKVKALIK